ncbi:Mak10-domain-containing protein [Tuber magnatum]|uniref:Mak10-domain-containing protein n=1 Tax=Tuber magnatum TaxID=42249 RepID=A0A317SMZ6_9PEZI|nr:Mak10-domain-containing protein [Tuber magnatum]
MGDAESNGVNHLAYPAEDFERFTLKEKRPSSIPAPTTNPIAPASQATMDSFRDVTTEFFEASEKLEIGQLIKDPYFTLLQAVGALEIMDPKMDSGMLRAEYESFDALQPRLPEEVVGIMDQLLCHEMAWHAGSALSQTLFTSLYIDRLLSSGPSALAEATFQGPHGEKTDTLEAQLLENVLQPFCIGLIKCCSHVNHQILTEQIYEEEDFVTQVYGVNLLEEVKSEEIVALLEGALSWLEGTGNSYPEEIRDAFRYRLLLRKSLVLVFSSESKEWSPEATDLWDTSLEHVKRVEETSGVGRAVPAAFSISVQRKLASQVPPRAMVNYPFKDAISDLKKFCVEGKDILKILNFEGSTNLVNYFLSFMTRRPSPSPYIRSLLQSVFFGQVENPGKLPIKQLLYDNLKELCYPAGILLDPQNDLVEAPQDPRFEITKRMNWFIERAGKSFLELFRNICQNRSRLRRTLCHSILDWDSLQVEAEEVDSELRQFTNEEAAMTPNGPSFAFPLSSWVYHYKLRHMEWIMLLGFELEVFQAYEFAGMYWYLQHYTRTRISHIERMLQFANRPTPGSLLERRKGSRSNSEQVKTLSLLNFYLLEATGVQELAGAMISLFTALSRLNLLKKPLQPFSSDALRYEVRMKPFFTIGCPEVIPFEDFQSLVADQETETSELLEMASESATDAKKNFDQLCKLDARTARVVLCEERYRMSMREMMRSCIGVGVATAVLSKALQEGKATPELLDVQIDRERYHPSFPAPKIVAKKR